MSNLLTNSRLRTYRECARKHRLMYDEGWRPRRESDALLIGSATHEGLAAWWQTESGGDAPLTAALSAVAGRLEDPHDQARVEELLRGYDARWLPTREDFETLLVEKVFVGPLLNPKTGAPSRLWVVGGKLDVMARQRSTSRALLVEHKTTSDEIEHSTDLYWDKLAMDSQVSCYYLGAELLGQQPEGCLYDVIRKPKLMPGRATPKEDRRYTKTGALYANQRDTDESPEQFRERLREEIASSPARYYQRREVPRTEPDLLDYLAETWAYAKQMREAERAGRAPKNPEACHRWGTCQFWECCAHGLRLEDHPSRFIRLTNVHPELGERGEQGEAPCQTSQQSTAPVA